jgi:type I restriction enzyme S subunit
MIRLKQIQAKQQESLDPSRFPREVFELFSIPAYDNGSPEIVAGADIGSTKKVVQPGDVLLSRIVPHIRRAWIVPRSNGGRQVASSEWIVFRSDAFLPSYLRHALMGDVFHAAFMNTVAGVGGSLLRARPAFVGEIEIPLPPLAEQKRIADILDKADGIRRKRRETHAMLNALCRSVFTDLFGSFDSCDPRHKWPVMRFGDLWSRPARNGQSPSARGTHRGNVLVLNAITGPEFDTTAVKAGLFDRAIDPSQIVDSKTFLICRGNGNLNLVGTGRFPTATMENTIYPDTIIAAEIRPDKMDSAYTEHVWMTKFIRSQIESGARTTNGTYKINQELLTNIQVPVPPLSLQKRFAQLANHCRIIGQRSIAAAIEQKELFESFASTAFA